MQLTPEDLARLQTKEVANAIRKLHAGKTLTGAERTLLAHATVSTETAVSAVTHVSTWDELGQRLGVSRRAIQDWRNDPRYKPEIEKRWPLLEKADGRKVVAEWLRLMVDLNLKRGAATADIEGVPDGDDESGGDGVLKPPAVGGSQADWNRAIAALDHRKKSNAIARDEGSLLVAADLEVPLGAMLSTFQMKGAAFPSRVAGRLTGLRDAGEIEDRLREELDADFADLQFASYLAADAVAAAVAGMPFDDESERLYQLVTFDGQDRAALLQLITAVATDALRQLGRRAIAAAQGSGITSPQFLREDESPASVAAPPASPSATQSETVAAPRQKPPRAVAKSARAKPRKGEKACAEKAKKPRSQPATAAAEVEAAAAVARPRKKTRRRKA